ncbi:MAG: enoyl-CoA hydratase/isomerase family protein [Hyphomicrobiaceae bacterium]|nr:MAG: enoyl-CoA hydratase [Alphaproteobacteria bacterium]
MIKLHRTGPVSTIVMSRAPVNAIDPAFVTDFHQALDEVERTQPTIVVVRSDQKCFSAGADLSLIRRFFSEAGGTQRMVDYVKTLHELFGRIEALPAVTLTCIAGPALGGGLELALSCDLRIATRGAKLGLPEARVGMIPGAGGTQRLTRLCGPGTASQLILGGEVVDGFEAARIGVVQWSVDDADLDGAVQRIVDRIAGLSRPALIAAKDCILGALNPVINGYALELEKPLLLMETEEARQRVERFFVPKPARA